MIQKQSYQIVPDGVIRGGNASYEADIDAGNINYSAEVDLPLWQKKSASGSYQVNPNSLKSSVLNLAGDALDIGPARFVCVGVENGIATVTVTISNITGTAEFDVTQEFLKLKSLTCKYSSFDLQMEET